MSRTMILTLSTLMLLAACSRQAATTATPVAAATLPADVRDLAKPKPATSKAPAAQTPAPIAAAASEVAPPAIAATGELISPVRSQVAPKQPGRVAAVFVREGARVQAGQPLAAFETDYLRLDLQRAEAELARAKAMESDAARDLARKRDLLSTESVSRATFDRAESAYESGTAARQAASAVVATIRQRIADATLRAPFDGVVESRRINPGERIGDAPAFVIAQTSPLKLRFHLPEQYLGHLREGQEVTATTEGAAFSARIAMIGGVIDPDTRTLMAEADVDNAAGHLRPGMFARIAIEK